MRRTLIFTLLLTVFAIGAIGYSAADIYPLRDQVTVMEMSGTEQYQGIGHFGDASAAEGLTANLKMDYYEAMCWDMKIHFGTVLPHTETSYTLQFPVQKSTRYLRERNELNIRVTVEDVVDNSAFAYLAEGLQPGQTRTEKVYLKDFADCYNTEVDILFPEVTYTWRPSDTTADSKTEKALKQLFDENFRFPLGESVSVDAHGDNHVKYGPGYGYGVNTSSDNFGLDIKEIFAEDRVYFTFNRKGASYQNLDVSLLPQGYGIYCLAVPEDGSQPTLTNVCPLNPDAHILKLTSDGKGNVLVHTVEYNKYTVLVIDTRTNTCSQRLELTEFSSNSSAWAVYEAENATAVTLGHKIDTRQIILLTMDDAGAYRIHWNLIIPSDQSRVLTYSDDSNKEYRYDYSPVMAWSGENLAFGLASEYRDGFDIAIYDENGLVYSDKYHTSLNIWPVQPDGEMPLTLAWDMKLKR